MTLILASNSPRRRELLSQHFADFKIVAANIDETPKPQESPDDYVKRMAFEKGFLISDRDENKSATVLAADTIVVLGDHILGKPNDDADAVFMLKSLSDKTHRVLTAFCVLRQSDGFRHEETVQTLVTFRPILESEILDYVATGEPRDKAGAYAIQGGAQKFVTKIQGSFENVVGLPIENVVCVIKNLAASYEV